ncbi:MAG: methyltransferase [Candidatus Micrarchaeaceae archaeon]
MEERVAKEGLATIKIKEGVFFNKEMKNNRDISVLFVKSMEKEDKSALDATTATGIRGIRYILEAGAKDVVFLDKNEKAIENCKENLALNSLQGAVVNTGICEYAHQESRKFDVIDIDPFGSPANMIECGIKLAHDKSMLLITATDTAVLCGAEHSACIKNYFAYPLHNHLCKEVGIRILLSKVAESASKHNFGIRPLVSISEKHYFRIIIGLEYGAVNAITSAKSIGFVNSCSSCGYFSYGKIDKFEREETCVFCKRPNLFAGPIWLGPIKDQKTLESVKSAGNRLLEEIKKEINVPFFYSLDVSSKFRRRSSLSREKVIEALRERSFSASATHIDPKGIRTDASIKEFYEEFDKIR